MTNTHKAIIDGRTAADTAFRSDREVRAALSCWLEDGTEIIRRCRVEGVGEIYCREVIAEVAMTAIRAFDDYRGISADPLDYAALRRWVERELAADPDAICATPISEARAEGGPG